MNLSKGQKAGLGIAGAGAVAIGFLYSNKNENSSTGGFNGFTETKKAIGDMLSTITTTTTETPGKGPISDFSSLNNIPVSDTKKSSYSGATRTNTLGDTVYKDNFVGPLPKGAIHETTSSKKELNADNKKFGGYNEFFQPVSKVPSSFNPFNK